MRNGSFKIIISRENPIMPIGAEAIMVHTIKFSNQIFMKSPLQIGLTLSTVREMEIGGG